MLMKDPNHRYPDCGDIIRDLGGLGLANPALSFIDSASGGAVVNAAVAVASGVGTSRMGATRSTGPAATQATTRPAASVAGGRLTSAEDAARSSAKPVPTGKLWYVQHKGADGKPVITRMSTGEIMAGIKGETLDPAAKAKDGPNGTFMPLIQYAEFESLASNRAAKLKADAKSRKTQEIYAKLDKQEQRRKRWRFLRNWVSNFKSLVGLLIYLAIFIALIGAGFWALTNHETIRGWFNSSPDAASQSTPQAAPQPAPQK
jgi:eukaryotic-like serine/threonine-protein kinase